MKLSIITINYNNCAGLQKTIDSVIAQTWRDFEWIVIDGGSTDGGKELIEKYQEHFAYWCSEPDKGIYNAMNKGVEKACGDYLLFLNSGDILHDCKTLEEAGVDRFSDDIVSGLTQRMDNGELLIHHERDIVMQLLWISLNHQGTFIKGDIFNKIKYDEQYRIVSDWKFWWDTIVFGNKSLKRINTIVANVEIGGISTNPQFDTIKNNERDSVLKSFFPPLVLSTLYDYQNLRFQYRKFQVDQLKYLHDRHNRTYLLVRKIDNLVFKLCKRIFKD